MGCANLIKNIYIIFIFNGVLKNAFKYFQICVGVFMLKALKTQSLKNENSTKPYTNVYQCL